MKVTTSKINALLLFKLPLAYIAGVRATYLDSEKCVASVKFRWINQNPFNSMYWAVQGMAAELTTGALVIAKIRESEHSISMLLASSEGSFKKRVTGKVTFTCNDGELVDQVIKKAVKTGEGESVMMNAVGIDKEGNEMSNFSFEWTIKVRS